jgi:glycosyltransferase involved in cell wall biosynthesis
MKKNILFIPSWYPTKDNPINGSFFQEQAVALMAEFNFIVGYVAFKRLNIVLFLYRLITFRLSSHIGKIDVLQPPLAITFVGYGLNLRHFSWMLPSILSQTFLKWLNEKLEIKTHVKMFKYIADKKQFNPDLIYALTSQINGVPVYEMGKKFKVPVVMAEHVPFSIDSIPFHHKEKVKHALEKADRLLVVSYDKARQILMGNINCNPIVIGNSVDESRFTLKPDTIKNEVPNILIVAAYNFYKDYETFFKCMRYLRTITKINFTITVIGISPNISKSEWVGDVDEFYNEFNKHNLNDITKVIKQVSRDDMAYYYHHSDVFVLTSIQEGLPVSVLEAMSCGLPVFSTRCGGVEDFINNNCGRLFHLRDFLSMAESLKEFLEGKIVFDKNYSML